MHDLEERDGHHMWPLRTFSLDEDDVREITSEEEHGRPFTYTRQGVLGRLWKTQHPNVKVPHHTRAIGMHA